MISQKYRFHGHASLKYVLANGEQARGHELSIKFIDNKRRRYSRVAVVVSKKVAKHAVDRNRIRRRVYEIMSNNLAKFNRVIDIVVIVYQPRVKDRAFNELVIEIDKCLDKLGIIKDK